MRGGTTRRGLRAYNFRQITSKISHKPLRQRVLLGRYYRLPKNDDSVVGSGFGGSSTTGTGFFG
jgi:hypothetical protein